MAKKTQRTNFLSMFKNFSVLKASVSFLVFYCIIVMLIIIWHFEIPCKGSAKTPKIIALYGVKNRIGEKLLYERTKITAEKLGWKVIGACVDERLLEYRVTRHFYYVAASILNLLYKPQFNLAVTHYIYMLPHGYNVVYLNVPSDKLFGFDGDFKESFEHLGRYNAYADLYSVTHIKNHALENALRKSHNKDALIIPVYLAQNYIEYSPATPDKMLFTGSLWGCSRESIRIMNLLQRFAAEDLLVAYGIKKNQLENLGNKYKGFIEDYDKNKSAIDNIINVHKKYGIALIIHTLEHMIEHIPTSRIAEAIASGAIVITDENPFIKKNFGDNVLYFNSLEEAEEMYEDVMHQLEWIRQNPEKAEEKARAAHKILMENFSLELQLQKLDKQLNFKAIS